jgi:hypothetical protein
VRPTLDDFREQLERSVRFIHVGIGVDEDWPGVLFVDDVGGIRVGGVFPVAGLSDEGKRALAEVRLPAALVRLRARRAAFVMPAWRHGEAVEECLVLLVVAPGGAQAVLAAVDRSTEAAALGVWSEPTVAVSGLFVDPLVAALAKPCPDCGTLVGERHADGCDVEECTVCRQQRFMCLCDGHDADAAAWEGEWPGGADCRRRGWYARRDERGWIPCRADEPGAREDLNRLAFFRATGVDGLYAAAE